MPDPKALSTRKILSVWWPLALSWMMMALELPAISAVVARLPDPKINLAAYGGIVFPLALIIEAPIIMLLAASTALTKNWDSYLKIRRFMNTTSGVLTIAHILIVSTPLYFFISRTLIGAPEVIILPARIGLAIMLPWTWAIAYRRFNQGILIRFGHSRVVSQGTMIRLGADLLVLMLGFWLGSIPGIVVATAAVAAGVTCEALFIGYKVQPVLQGPLREQPGADPPLTRKAFLEYYIPLALTSVITLLSQPLISTALSRMPRALDSLAVWPVLSGLLFLFRSLGVSYNEAVVSLLEKPHSYQPLKRFARGLAFSSTGLLLLVSLTPLSDFWFQVVSSLPPALGSLAGTGLLLCLFIPGLNALQSWHQGLLLHSGNTRPIPQAVGLFLLATITVYAVGILSASQPGIIFGALGFSTGMAVQTIWLGLHSRRVRPADPAA